MNQAFVIMLAVSNLKKVMEDLYMPLNLADINTPYHIQKICGPEDQRHYLESLGLVENCSYLYSSSFLGIT